MLNLPKFTFINGPPGSGKSTLADLLCQYDKELWQESFAQPIRDMMYAVFYPEEGPISFTFDLRDSTIKKAIMKFQPPCEDEGCPNAGIPHICNPITNRAAMISFSEVWMKPVFGNDIFGRLCYARCQEQELFYSRFIIDDSGFREEADYIIHQVGVENCHLIRLHRNGCSFASDSRSHITLPGVQTLDLHNDEHPDAMLDVLQLEFGTL